MRIRLPVARLASVALFALLCAIVAGWALQLLSPRAPIAPSGAVAQALPPPDLSGAGRLFGAPPAAAAASGFDAPTNITVAGIVAAGPRSVALLAVDGRPPKAFAVGESVADGMKVASVSAQGVEIDARGRTMRLAAPVRPSLDVLTSGPQRGGTATSSAPPPPLRPLPPAGAAAPMPPQPGEAPAPQAVTPSPPQAQAPGAPPGIPPGLPPGVQPSLPPGAPPGLPPGAPPGIPPGAAGVPGVPPAAQ